MASRIFLPCRYIKPTYPDIFTAMKKLPLVILAVLVTVPYFVFLCRFAGDPFSTEIKDWADFGTYINGIQGPLMALSVGYLGYIISQNQNAQSQAEKVKEENTRRPLAAFEYTDYPDTVLVEITNKGLGPMYIIGYKINHENEGEITAFKGFFSLLKRHGIGGMFSLYTESINGFALSPNERLKLFEITRTEIIHNICADDADSSEENITAQDIEEYLNEIRNVFASCTLCITFEDIYKNPYSMERDMAFFNRNMEEEEEA